MKGLLRTRATYGGGWCTRAAVCAALILSIEADFSVAQDAQLQEVKIHANRLEESLPEALAQFGTRVDTVTGDEYANLAFVDASRGLDMLVPGLSVRAKNGPFDYADISLQGSRTADVLFLVDGVRINNRLYGTTPPLDTLPAAMIERVETIEGGQALFYGTSAVAGAVNIVTRPFTASPDGAVTFGTDSEGGRRFNGYFSDSFGGQHFVLYGSSDRTDGFHAFRDQDYQPSSTDRDRGYNVQAIGAKYGYEIEDTLRLSATYQHTDADLDFASPMKVALNVNSRREDLATAKIDYTLNERLSLFIKGYYHKWNTHYDTLYNDLRNPGNTIVVYNNAFWGYDDRGVNALMRVSVLAGLEAFLGYDLQRYGGRDEVLFIEPKEEQTQAVFGQIRLSPQILPRTHITAGFRYNRPDVGEQATIWNVSGQYDIRDNLFVRTTLGTNFRLPSAEELFADDPQDERGNPHIKPEKSRSINGSVGGTLQQPASRIRWELIGFARDIRNLIDFVDFDDATGQDVFGNLPGVVKVRGGEAVAEATLGSGWTVSTSYTYNRSRTDGGAQTNRVPEQLGRLTADYHPGSLPVGGTIALDYTGRTYNRIGTARVPYGNDLVVDIAGRYFFDSDRRHRLVLSLQNVFDRQYGSPSRACADIPTDGPNDCSAQFIAVNRGLPRTLRAQYSYSFK